MNRLRRRFRVEWPPPPEPGENERVLQLFYTLRAFLYGIESEEEKVSALEEKILELSDLNIRDLWKLADDALMKIAKKYVRREEGEEPGDLI